ncbi:hypothetical protein PG984_013871 [Apiospora sp. TS-2023a]
MDYEKFYKGLPRAEARDQYQDDRCVRHGLGIALRRTPKRDTRVQGYQVILYEPEYAELTKQPREQCTDDADRDELFLNLHPLGERRDCHIVYRFPDQIHLAPCTSTERKPLTSRKRKLYFAA